MLFFSWYGESKSNTVARAAFGIRHQGQNVASSTPRQQYNVVSVTISRTAGLLHAVLTSKRSFEHEFVRDIDARGSSASKRHKDAKEYQDSEHNAS